MTASVQITQLLDHVLNFTQTENTSLIYWNRGQWAIEAQLPGAHAIANDCWAATSLFEHYDSALDPNPANRTAEEVTVYNTLQANATASQAKLDAILGVSTEETVRVNTNVATFVAGVLASL